MEKIDGFCHGGQFNTFACGYDGGDCVEFNYQLVGCKVLNETYVNTPSAAYQLPALGDGVCDVSIHLEYIEKRVIFFANTTATYREEILTHQNASMIVAIAMNVIKSFLMQILISASLVTAYVIQDST